MSYDTNKTWYYQLLGRDLQLYQYVQSANTDTVAGYRIKLPLDYYANQLIYPNEDITDGLRIEYTKVSEPFVDKDPETTVDSGLTEVTGASITESSHINLNKVLSLAVVSYVKAKVAERQQDLQGKEYYMREFWKRVADNKSNMKRVHIVQTQPVFNLK